MNIDRIRMKLTVYTRSKEDKNKLAAYLPNEGFDIHSSFARTKIISEVMAEESSSVALIFIDCENAKDS